MRDNVDQFATPDGGDHDRAVRSQPAGVVGPNVPAHHLHRYQQAPADFTRKARFVSMRPLRPSRTTWYSDSQATARTGASRASERSAFIAFGWSATPAPI